MGEGSCTSAGKDWAYERGSWPVLVARDPGEQSAFGTR
jgi:hypothetical protein